MTSRETLTNYVYTIANTLIQAGVKDVVISPGSRSTPLAYAFASLQDELNVYRHIDERAAGFFALGIAKAKGKPVVLVCTSGTAAANYYPAIVEAHYSRVPLIVLTADRPHELREVGAPQTINQVRIFGEQVKWSAEFPIPDDAKETLPYIERHTARAAAISIAAPMGPVHLNIPFREPLLIDFDKKQLRGTFRQSFVSSLAPSDEAITQLDSTIAMTSKGIVVLGELSVTANVSALWAFIEKLKWPVLVESLSNFRSNVPESCMSYVISTYDATLKNEAFKQAAKPETVIRFGAQPVSKFLMQFIAASEPNTYIVVDEDPMFRDSISSATHYIHANVGEWLRGVNVSSNLDKTYLNIWQQAEQRASQIIEQYATWSLDEGMYVQALLEQLPNGSDLFVSNSMPIRDIDTFLLKTMKDIRIIANRGANGIDGVISTALGYSVANPTRHTYLLIGDLAFLHDSNAFVATRYQNIELSVIVMNNDGGGIFSYLPQAKVEEHYEELFGTPTALTFEKLAEMYTLKYEAIQDLESFTNAINRRVPLQLLEVFTNREQNTANHRKLWRNISEELDSWLLSK